MDRSAASARLGSFLSAVAWSVAWPFGIAGPSRNGRTDGENEGSSSEVKLATTGTGIALLMSASLFFFFPTTVFQNTILVRIISAKKRLRIMLAFLSN